MSADIEKLAVFDSRIVQSRPRYAVEKGALSLTNAPFNAISATASQHTYNIYVPSENVFVDRAVEWTSTVTMSSVITPSGTLANWALNFPIVVPGVDFALTAFPLNSLCSTMTATINDTTSVINSQDVLKEVLRLTDYKKNRLQRTCPTMLDKYQCYDDAYGLPNCPLNGYGTAMDYDGVQNGAFGQIVFTDSAGQPLVEGKCYTNGVLTATQGAVPSTAIAGTYRCVNGLPSLVASTGNSGVVDCAGPFTIFYQWTSTEKLVLSPFTFSDVHEWDTGLFGINNIQLIMNLQSPLVSFATRVSAGIKELVRMVRLVLVLIPSRMRRSRRPSLRLLPSSVQWSTSSSSRLRWMCLYRPSPSCRIWSSLATLRTAPPRSLRILPSKSSRRRSHCPRSPICSSCM